MYLSSMGHTPTYPNCVVVSSLSSGLCIYGVSKLGAWNLGQWGLASWNDNAILEIYRQGRNRFGHLMPFELGAGEPCNTAGTQPRWWTTTWWNAWKKNMISLPQSACIYIYIYHLNNNILCQEPAIARSMHGVVLSRYAVRCPLPVLCWEMWIGIGRKDLHDVDIPNKNGLCSIHACLHFFAQTSQNHLCLYAAPLFTKPH